MRRERQATRGLALLMLLLVGLALDAHAGETAGGTAAAIGDAMAPPPDVRPGDISRGRSIVADRQLGFCLLCHSGPFPEVQQQGTIAPSIAGAGLRWSEAQLRLRVTDSRRLNPDSVMPSYGISDPAPMVQARYRGKPLLTAQQIEDVTAYLVSLRD